MEAETLKRLFRHILIVLTQRGTDEGVIRAAQDLLGHGWGGRLTVLELGAKGDAPPFPLGLDFAVGEGVRVTGVRRPGGFLDETLRQAQEDPPDLIVAAESGLATQKLIRHAPSTLLLVPAQQIESRGPLLVPVDFGPSSLEAARLACHLGRAGGREIELVHVYQVPMGWHKLGLGYRHFVSTMHGHADTDLGAFVKQLGVPPCNVKTRPVLGTHPASALITEAWSGRYSQVVMGYRPRITLTSLLMGTVTERLVLSSPLPVWVVRPGTEGP